MEKLFVHDYSSEQATQTTVGAGNSGLGLETIRQLCELNPKTIFLAARSEAKYDLAIRQLKMGRLRSSTNIEFLPLDLADFSSIRAAAWTFLKMSDRLDVLILNAGIFQTTPGFTKSGHEVHFGTNYLGHALLTKLLLRTLETTAELYKDVRIVVISSSGHHYAPVTGGKFDHLMTDMESNTPLQRYGLSKLASILWATQFAELFPNITTVCVDPGVVQTRMLTTACNDDPEVRNLQPGNVVTVEDGALLQFLCATTAAETLENGTHYSKQAVGRMVVGLYLRSVRKIT